MEKRERKKCYGWSLHPWNINMLVLRPAYYAVLPGQKEICKIINSE